MAKWFGARGSQVRFPTQEVRQLLSRGNVAMGVLYV